MITAENEHGEGYKSEKTFMIKTTTQNFLHDGCSLFCWGNNANSELALPDEQVKKNDAFYVKHSMRKILNNTLFESGSLLQVAPGNASTIFLYLDKESNSQSVLQGGLTVVAKDEKSD
jgi:hypothetical protein